MSKAFTLIEMSIVLLIIAVVTHLAMRQLGNLRERKLVDAADRQLEEIRESVYSRGGGDGQAGFLVDMGRLVSVTNGTMAELWRQPSDARPFAVRPAVAENFVKLPNGLLGNLTNANVFVGTGWRGPYLRLALGKKRLMDPWGNPLENPDSAGYDRLGVTNGVVVSVSHFGPTALSRDPYSRVVSLLPDGGFASRLVVKAVSAGGHATSDVTYKWYGPKSGWITGGVTNVPYGVSAQFSGLTPGVSVVWDSASGVSRQVKLLPGDNQMEITVP